MSRHIVPYKPIASSRHLSLVSRIFNRRRGNANDKVKLRCQEKSQRPVLASLCLVVGKHRARDRLKNAQIIALDPVPLTVGILSDTSI